jgi:signal transduction histidine kinase
MASWNLQSKLARSPLLRYGFSVACVAIAMGLELVFRHYRFREIAAPPFNLAIAVAAWYGGVGPAVLALVLSAACFDYFFSLPIYSFTISSEDLPSFVAFTAWALLIASFAGARRRIEDDLSDALDRLQVEVEQRKQQEDEIRKLNQKLANRAAELESSNKELESFAYSVSHDLRAPLRHVVGYSELLQKHSSSFDDKGHRYITTILEAAKRMGVLIDDLLAFSRIGRAATKKTLVNLGELLKEVVTEIQQETAGREIGWKISALPVCYGDYPMLRVVLVNLVSNAVKFTRMRMRAEIEIGCTHGDNDDLEVFVRDNGAGFDMRYANKLFGVFQRLHRTEEFEGTGIGLATVQRIIHRHGGKVRAEGAVDQGATFYFSLPKAPGAETSAASAI